MIEKKKPPQGQGWKPGQSGNPKGRPKGSGDVAKIRSAIATCRIPDDHMVACETDAGVSDTTLSSPASAYCS